MSNKTKVKIIRASPKLQIEKDARDNYIGIVGKILSVDIVKKLVLVLFDDGCKINFKEMEVVNE